MSGDLKQDIPSVAEIPDAVLLPYQQQWIADESDFKVCEKSRRIGITWDESSDDVLISASSNNTSDTITQQLLHNQ